MGSFDGRVGIVTGAGTGIGRASAELFASRGAAIVVADISVDAGQETVELIRSSGGVASFVAADVSVPEECERLVQTAVANHGRLDFAHNNAARSPRPYLAVDVTAEEWEADFHTNLLSVSMCMKFEIRQFLAQGSGGAIVNMSSAAATKTIRTRSSYSAGKAGVLTITAVAAAENAAQGVRINAILPGPVRTANLARGFAGTPGMEENVMATIPLGRVGEATDLAQAIVWLCSDEASWITGIGLHVDGGQHLAII